MIVFSTLQSMAQVDTTPVTDSLPPYINKDFSTYSSSFQFSMGQNLTVGDYGDSKTPFSDGFATSYHYKQLSLNAKYSQNIKKNYGFEVGAEFFRNAFDWQKFGEAYLENTGDSMRASDFYYEHISLFGGVNYNKTIKKLMFSIGSGVGALYTSPIRGNADGVGLSVTDFTPNNSNGYKGGSMIIKNTIMPMFYAGVSMKFYLGDEFYIVANSHYTYSLFKIKVIEETHRIERRDYLDKTLTINNISLTLGLGTLF